MIRTLTPIFSILIAIFVFFFVARPMFVEIKNVQDETEEYERAVVQAEALNQKLNALLAEKNQFSDLQKENLEIFLPSSINEVRILTDLKEMAVGHRMMLGNVQVSDEATVINEQNASGGMVSYSDLVSADISFALIGTYDQFKAMLRDIERSLVLMEVINVTFSASEGDLMQFDVAVRVYALPNQSTNIVAE